MSELRLEDLKTVTFISEHCKKTTHHTKSPSLIFLNLSRASCMYGRVDINWLTFMRPRSRYVTWYVEKCQLVPVRIPSLFQQNVLKAVGRTQIEGSCKVYAIGTQIESCTRLYPGSLAIKKWGAPHKVTLAYLLEPFPSFLHVWPCRRQVSYFHACREQICQFQLVPVRRQSFCADTPRKLEVSTPCP